MVRGYDRRVSSRANGLEMAPFDPVAIAAVEAAQQTVGFDLTDADRDKLIDAIMLSCTTDRHSFSYEKPLTFSQFSKFPGLAGLYAKRFFAYNIFTCIQNF